LALGLGQEPGVEPGRTFFFRRTPLHLLVAAPPIFFFSFSGLPPFSFSLRQLSPFCERLQFAETDTTHPLLYLFFATRPPAFFALQPCDLFAVECVYKVLLDLFVYPHSGGCVRFFFYYCSRSCPSRHTFSRYFPRCEGGSSNSSPHKDWFPSFYLGNGFFQLSPCFVCACEFLLSLFASFRRAVASPKSYPDFVSGRFAGPFRRRLSPVLPRSPSNRARSFSLRQTHHNLAFLANLSSPA